jgi:tetratricopeptide (TPR) repeat protein
MYRLDGNYEKAASSFSESRDFFRESGALEWEAIALRGLAETYRDQGFSDSAIRAYQDSIEIFRKVSDNRREARALLELAKIYDLASRPEDADRARNRLRQLSGTD